MTSVGLEPAAPWSRVKHSFTEPLRSRRVESLNNKLFENFLYKYIMYLMGFFLQTTFWLKKLHAYLFAVLCFHLLVNSK